MQREAIESAIRERAAGDAAFRDDLVADPAGAIERAFGVAIPASVTLRVVEEASDEVILVLPGGGPLDLAEAELDEFSAAQYLMTGGVQSCAITSSGQCV